MLTRHGARFPMALKLLVTALSAAFAVTLASAFSWHSVPLADAAVAPAHPRITVTQSGPDPYPVNPFKTAASILHARHLHHIAVKEAEAKAAAQRAWAKAHPPAPQALPATQDTVQVQASYTGSGIQACIIRAESGGNPQIWNATGHWGLYQFSYGTWVAHGGPPADFGHAGVAEQNQVYYNTVAVDGYSDWAPYDGC